MKKVLPFIIPKTENESFRIQIDESPYFYDTLHKHSEVQITLILKSEGTLICGDYIGNFKAGDLFVIGSNQPHVIRNNDEYYNDDSKGAHAISLFFDKNSLGREFFNLPEIDILKQFLLETQRGLKFSKNISEQFQNFIHSIEHKTGLNRIIGMITILQLLAETKEFSFLASINEIKNYDEKEGKRMNQIFQFTLKEFYRDIRLDEVAEIANMTPNAFCRYFKQRTRKTYMNFLSEIRIAHASKLLNNKDLSVSQICYQSGFNNLSNFNRKFKKIKGCSPSSFITKSNSIFDNK